MNDVAALPRVSIQTVSRAINGQPIVRLEIVHVVMPTCLTARGSRRDPGSIGGPGRGSGNDRVEAGGSVGTG
jgi:hypothetical protein